MVVSAGPLWLGYLSRAQGLQRGLGVLSGYDPQTSFAWQFLAGWTLELALKSYLSYRGWSEKQLRDVSIRHNLVKLWDKSAEEGLPVAIPPPRWCALLSSLHEKPFHLRYPVQDVAGHIGPNIEETMSGVREIISAVERILQPS